MILRTMLLVTMGAASALAVINPQLTPVHLVRQSESVWWVEWTEKDERGNVTAIAKRLHGRASGERARLAKLPGELTAQGGVLFAAKGTRSGLMYAGGVWLRMNLVGEMFWQAGEVDKAMMGTWNGGADMLARAVEHVSTRPDAEVPVAVAVQWAKSERVKMEWRDEALPVLLVADVDGSGQPVQLGLGKEGPLIGLQTGTERMFTGDFDADGLLDVVALRKWGVELWQNLGSGKFREVLAESGDVAGLRSKVCRHGVTCDINNDGRQDLVFLTEDGAPKFYFNRGFRCFAAAAELDVRDVKAESLAVRDWNGDGAQDLAMRLQGGEMRLWTRRVDEAGALALVVDCQDGRESPLTVTGHVEGRNLGAWHRCAFFGLQEPGLVTVRWRGVDGKLCERKVLVENGVTRVTLPVTPD
jgi:hypothetical protein